MTQDIGPGDWGVRPVAALLSLLQPSPAEKVPA
jgi:hypothetical protein